MTFVEVLVATALIALVLGGLLPLLTSGQLTWEHAHRRTPMVQNSRTAVDTLTHSLRAAQNFLVLGPTNIRFTYFFGDGTTPTVEFRYNAATGELEYRWDPDPFQPLGGPFTSMTVSCFDVAGTASLCSNAVSVRSVQVALTALDPDGNPITFSTRAFRQVP